MLCATMFSVQYLVEVVELASHPDVPVAGDVGGLAGAEQELELGVLEAGAALGHLEETGEGREEAGGILPGRWPAGGPRGCRRTEGAST